MISAVGTLKVPTDSTSFVFLLILHRKEAFWKGIARPGKGGNRV
jgi:hypothetical protein